MRKTYPSYRKSGVPWLGEVPAHWAVRRLKNLCSSYGQYGANIPASQYQETGIRFIRTTDITEEGSLTKEGVYLQPQEVADHILNHDDILLSRSGTIGRSFIYQRDIHEPCAFAGYLVRFAPETHQLARYIHLFTKTTAFGAFLRTEAISSTIENVNAEKYANCHVPLPPPAEQTAIAAFLDRETARINHLIAKHELLIERLAEYRNAVITQTVTKGLPADASRDAGLDPEPRMKSSGSDWIGEVPEHWQIKKLKYAATTNDDVVAESEDPLREILYVDIGSINPSKGMTATEEMVLVLQSRL